MRYFPYLSGSDGLLGWAQEVIKAREEDVKDYDSLVNRFMTGRRTMKIPASSADVVAADNIGDFSTDGNYLYFLVDVSGTPLWRRVSLSSW